MGTTFHPICTDLLCTCQSQCPLCAWVHQKVLNLKMHVHSLCVYSPPISLSLSLQISEMGIWRRYWDCFLVYHDINSNSNRAPITHTSRTLTHTLHIHTQPSRMGHTPQQHRSIEHKQRCSPGMAWFLSLPVRSWDEIVAVPEWML